ncbi:hypothetical protein VNO80_25473 [Phaseolus coccineus]|uniref:Uncharacterized protein n=1 Tax=Phaseolus coccineus TaxID=3886 RepID=A0AAN9LZJ5_PHACN
METSTASGSGLRSQKEMGRNGQHEGQRSLKEVQFPDGAIHGDVSLKLSRGGSPNSRSEAHTHFEGNKGEVTRLPNVGVGMIDIVGQIGDLMGLSQSPETRKMKEVRRSDVPSRKGPQTNLINHRDSSDIGIVEMERSFNMFGEEGEFVKKSYKTPERVRRLRTLRETNELRVQPWWKSLHYCNNSSFKFSILSNAESASDIIHCNNRLRNEEFVDVLVRIWEVGKQLGMECLGDEGMVTSQLKARGEVFEVYDSSYQSRGREQVGVGMDVAAAGMDFIIYADLNVEL